MGSLFSIFSAITVLALISVIIAIVLGVGLASTTYVVGEVFNRFRPLTLESCQSLVRSAALTPTIFLTLVMLFFMFFSSIGISDEYILHPLILSATYGLSALLSYFGDQKFGPEINPYEGRIPETV